jgi:glucokinase
LLADVGGTFARLACWSPDRGLHGRRQYANADYAGMAEVLAAYRAACGMPRARALLALALPVADDALRFTNRNWQVSARQLARTLQLPRLVIVNDFVAAAAGALARVDDPDACCRIDALGTPRGAVRVVLGSGTGLGVAAIVDGDTGAPPRILESEGGHMSFAAGHDVPDLVRAARAQWGRVSWERLLCGDGIAWVDAQLRGAGTAHSAARVVELARAGEAGALAALRWYAHALGAFAGDLCLALRATGGVLLAGGVVARLDDLFDGAAFRAGFTDKGRFAQLLREVPCWRFSEPDLALHGLAALLSGKARAPGLDITEGAT